MIVRRLAAAAAIAGSLAAALAATPAAAQFGGLGPWTGQNVSGGEDCRALAAAIGPGKVWYSRFTGNQHDAAERKWWARGEGCFRTQKACKAWLYSVQTAYPYEMNFTFCRRGLR